MSNPHSDRSDYPPLPKSQTPSHSDRESREARETNDLPIPDLESHLREMILGNRLSKGPASVRPNNEETTQLGVVGYVPPHLRLASAAEQEEYLSRHKNDTKPPAPTVKKPRKRISQAERKRAARNQSNVNVPATQLNVNDKHTVPAEDKAIHQNGHGPYVNGNSIGSPESKAFRSDARVSYSKGKPFETRKPDVQRQSNTIKAEIQKDPVKSTPQLTANLSSLQHPGDKEFDQPNTKREYRSTTFGRYPPQQLHQQQYQVRAHHEQPNPGARAPYNYNGPYVSPRHHDGRNSQSVEVPPHLARHSYRPQFPYNRPRPPPNHELINPYTQQAHCSAPMDVVVPGHMQVEYLERLASVEIAKVEITREELKEKENLRRHLDKICREAITAYEIMKDAMFDPTTIALKCFGSLSSGYATRGSDMDLVLVSPTSIPDTASPVSEIPRILEKTLLELGYGARLLTRTRVPIIRFCEKPNSELLEALRAERTKWETKRDAPSNRTAQGAPTQKSRRKLKRKDSAAQKAKKDAAKTDLKLHEGGLDGQNDVEATPDSSGAASSEEDAIGCIDEKCRESLEEEQVMQERVKVNYHSNTSLSNPEEPCNGVARETPGEPSLSHGEEAQTPDEVQNQGKGTNRDLIPTHQHLAAEKPHIERPKKAQPVRTDEELVRLYQLAMSEDWFNDDERKIIFRFINSAKNPEKSAQPCDLDKAREALKELPDVLSRYREKFQDTHLDFPKEGVGIQCDINFSNLLALHNTLLLRCYSHCDPRIRPMVLFVKAWAKRRKINSPYHGTLSSYGYVLMVLHYVVNIANPPLAPNLQISWKAPPNEPPEDIRCNGCDVRFWRSEKDIRHAARRGMLTQNRSPLGSLLRGFFHYFAHEGRDVPCGGFSWGRSVLSLRTQGGTLSKQEKNWTGARTEIIEPTVPGQYAKEIRNHYLLAIEDPFELDHNVARPVVHHGIVAIREEFRRAIWLIQRAGVARDGPQDLFAEGQEHVQKKTFFGPNPAHFINRPKRFGPQKPPTNGNTEDKRIAEMDETVQCAGNGVGVEAAVVAASHSTHEAVEAAVDRGDETVSVFRTVEDDVSVEDPKDGVLAPGSPISLDEDIRG